MYAVVGCSECSALWVIEGDPETSECPRCGSRRPRERRREFYRSDDADEAREARSRLLAERQGESGAFDDVDHFAALEAAVDDAGPDEETYLEASGLDPEAVAEAGERASSSGGSGRSREDTVRAAIRSLDEPDTAAVASYCEARGVGAEAAETILEKLVRAGEVSRREGGYRLL
jgi:DNA-directed RNA polymerase subunit RPC12/RpoP